MIEFILPPLLAGASLSLATGSLGCFVVWNRMAFFGETLAHSALLGVVLGLLLQINLGLAVAALALFVALSLWQMQRSSALGNDTLLGILSHSSLALGLVGISLIENTRVNVYSLLVGDLLTVTWQEVTLVLLVSDAPGRTGDRRSHARCRRAVNYRPTHYSSGFCALS